MLFRHHPVSLSPQSLFTVSARVCAFPDRPVSPVPFWLKNPIFKMSYTLFYSKLCCRSQTRLTWILGVHVYNSSKAFNVNEFSQKRNVGKRKGFLSFFLSFFSSFLFFRFLVTLVSILVLEKMHPLRIMILKKLNYFKLNLCSFHLSAYRVMTDHS